MSQLIVRLWIIQWVLLGLPIIGLYWIQPIIAYSIALGALTFWLPNAYFAFCVFRYRGERSQAEAGAMLRSVYRGEMNKLVLTAVGFAVIFSLVKPINAVALLLAYIAMNIIQLLVASRWR